MNMGLETMSFEPDEEESYQQQAMDLVDDRIRTGERNSEQQNGGNENNNDVKDNGENSERLSSLVEEALALQELVEEGNDQSKPEGPSAVEENIQNETETTGNAAERIPDNLIEILEPAPSLPKPEIKPEIEPDIIEGTVVEDINHNETPRPGPGAASTNTNNGHVPGVVENPTNSAVSEQAPTPVVTPQTPETPARPISETIYVPSFTVTERPHPATSPEGIEWQDKDSQLKSDLYEKNEAWTTNPTQQNYQAYIESYDTLARHNTAAWHNDSLTKEGVYSQYRTNAQKPEVDKVERSILMSGNLYFNQAKPDKITDQEMEAIAKTLMWERLKNPAVVDFEFAQGFRVNLWVMREETRKLLEEKVRDLGGNNYNHLPHAQANEQRPTPPASTAVAPETNIGQAENSQEVVETTEQEPEEEPGPENEETRYARILKKIRKNGVANERDREEWAETIDHLLELNDPEKARELAQERINGAERLEWEGNNNNKMVNALILAAAIRKREEMQKDAKSQEDQEIFLKEYLKKILGQEADEREVAEFLKQTTELKNVHA